MNEAAAATTPAHALLALWNDVAPEHEAAYNDWHAREHVPERLTVPGMLWARRYRLHAGTGMPGYLTLYGLQDPAVLDSAPYQRLLREPTVMSARMRPALQNLSRWVCGLAQPVAAPDSPQLAVWVMAGDAPDDAATAKTCLLAERLQDASALPWLAPQQDHAIDGRWLLCAPQDTDASPPAPDALIYRRLPIG